MAIQGPKAARGIEIRSAIQLKQSVFSADGIRVVEFAGSRWAILHALAGLMDALFPLPLVSYGLTYH